MIKVWMLFAACATLCVADDAMPDTAISELRPMIERFSADLRSLTRSYPVRLSATRRRSFDGSYEPIYQCAYMLGALQFYALHKELVGGKMTDKAFHDGVLKENRIPVEMIRADLSKQKLTADFASSWRFWK
jgi:hypothetical protein